MTKIRYYKGHGPGDNVGGFEATFSPDPRVVNSGWSDVVHMFGPTNEEWNFWTEDLTFGEEITDLAICVDNDHTPDVERLKFIQSDGTTDEIGTETYICDTDGLNVM